MYLILVLSVSFGALFFANWLIGWIMALHAGTSAMMAVSEPIREGSEGAAAGVFEP